MTRLLSLVVAVVFGGVLSLTPQASRAFTQSELFLPFDARTLTFGEKRFLQTALAFAGEYNGLLDGDWGGRSQRALESFLSKVEGGGRADNLSVVIIAQTFAELFRNDGWQQEYIRGLDMSFLVPTARMGPGEPSDIFNNFDHLGSSLGYSTTIGPTDQMVRLHSFAEEQAGLGLEVYTVRKPQVMITATRTAEGRDLYVRSDLRGQTWSTVLLSALPQDKGTLGAVTGSIEPGGPTPISLPASGKLVRGMQSVAELMASGEGQDSRMTDGAIDRAAAVSIGRTPPQTSPAPAAPPSLAKPVLPGQGNGNGDAKTPSIGRSKMNAVQPSSTGTGFYVSQGGDVLTNAHVVDGCAEVTVDGLSGKVLALEPEFDLALISTGQSSVSAAFSSSLARLNSDVTVVGYPLSGLLGGLNVTRGAVTSLKGLGGSPVEMQISAPVQPGNSGGPVLSAGGDVVGVVVAKLDAAVVAEATGDIPQNVNFAIRGEIAKLFLSQNGVEPVLAENSVVMAPEDIAETAKGFTVLIGCYR